MFCDFLPCKSESVSDTVIPRFALVCTFETSIAILDSELDILTDSFGKTFNKMHVRYPKPDKLATILGLENMLERDMAGLRRTHPGLIVGTTNFWKARNDGYGLENIFKIAMS